MQKLCKFEALSHAFNHLTLRQVFCALSIYHKYLPQNLGEGGGGGLF